MFHVGSMLSHSFDIHTISIHALNLCITKLQRPRITRLLDSVQLLRATPTSLPSTLHIRLNRSTLMQSSCQNYFKAFRSTISQMFPGTHHTTLRVTSFSSFLCLHLQLSFANQSAIDEKQSINCLWGTSKYIVQMHIYISLGPFTPFRKQGCNSTSGVNIKGRGGRITYVIYLIRH